MFRGSLDDKDGSKADLIDGSIGELSLFQDTFGYYAQGVVSSTAVLPSGWKKRLIPYKTNNTGETIALCLEPNDLWVSKAIAGRKKDWEFCQALLKNNLVDIDTIKSRLSRMKNLDAKVSQEIYDKLGLERRK